MQMNRAGNYMVFVAADCEKVIGFIGLQTGLAFEYDGKVMRIIALAVAHDFQNQGIGGALIQRAEEYAEEVNVSVIAVNSGLKRTRAHRFYERHSFYKKGYSFFKKTSR